MNHWDADTEDWPKRSWDFHTPSGPAHTLEAMVEITGRAAGVIARELLTQAYGRAAPADLLDEARALLAGQDSAGS